MPLTDQLNAIAGAIAFSEAHFGEGSGSIVLDAVDCSGSERELDDCPANSFPNCTHEEDAGVQCAVISM